MFASPSFSAHMLESACGHSRYSPPKTRMTFSQKVAKYHGVSVGVAIIQRGYIRMRIDPDDSNVLVFPVQVIEEGRRHHTVAADGHDSVGVFCRKLPLRILNPR